MISDDYYRRYTELQNLILKGYIDYYTLQEIGNHSKLIERDEKNNLLGDSQFVLAHFSEITKEDLGLILWKILDNNAKSNTLVTLQKELRVSFRRDSNTTLTTRTKRIRDHDLSNLRQKFLAHNDIEKSGTEIKIEDLYFMLEDSRAFLNALCFNEIDERVFPLSNQTIYALAFHAKWGVGWMMEHSMIPIAESRDTISEKDILALFHKANNRLVTLDKDLFNRNISERTLCGALMLHLHDLMLENPRFKRYYVDVEYNRNKGQLKRTRGMKDGYISCDLIVHSRGSLSQQNDNLLAIEMKKSTRSRKSRDDDRKRLEELTSRGGFNFITKERDLFVSEYQLGVYYEIHINSKKVADYVKIDYYRNGSIVNCFSEKVRL